MHDIPMLTPPELLQFRTCPESMPPFFKVTFPEGVYEVRRNEIGIFRSLAEPAGDSGRRWSDGFDLLLPKIPVGILTQIIAAFKCVAEDSGAEMAAHVYWSLFQEKYYIVVPRQRVTAISIQVEWDQEQLAKDILVLDIHSHHSMAAFWSETDNRDERACRFYAVVGRIQRFFPAVKLRFANGGRHVQVPLDSLFSPFEHRLDLTQVMIDERSAPNE